MIDLVEFEMVVVMVCVFDCMCLKGVNIVERKRLRVYSLCERMREGRLVESAR